MHISKKWTKAIVLGIVVVFIFLQFIPVDRTAAGNGAGNEPRWDSQKTRAYAVRACFDCHSSQTKWPAYSYVAPVSWFVAGHVKEGRDELNFSGWKYSPKIAREIVEVVKEGKMPLKSYLLLHPEARLNEFENREFLSGLEKTFNFQPEISSDEDTAGQDYSER